MTGRFAQDKIAVHTLIKWEAANLQHALGYLDISDESKAHYWASLNELIDQLDRRRSQLLAGGL